MEESSTYVGKRSLMGDASRNLLYAFAFSHEDCGASKTGGGGRVLQSVLP